MNTDVIETLREHEDPFVTAIEIADRMDKSKGTIHDRLDELLDEGKVNRKKVGGRAVVWWLPERERQITPS
jgi:predicted transcriptional regulator